MTARLVWDDGIGHLDASPVAYDAAYFDKYVCMADTDMGRALTRSRLDLVARHHAGDVLDVGIGCGQFVTARMNAGGNTCGFDVNPTGIAWLRVRGLYRDLYDCEHEALTFWDSLEHIETPAGAVATARKWVFVSLPIFLDVEHCMTSKHFRPGEHIWYFTDAGLRRWFGEQGFECVEANTAETDLGREDIGSYAFRRID